MVHNYELQPILTTLEDGGVILYPTDTIWGIGCDATNEAALEKVHELKKGNPTRPFIILVSSLEMLRKYTPLLHPRLDTLLRYHKRPLTIIYEKAINLAPNATAPDGSVGIRIVKDKFCRDLIEAFGRPIVSASANIFEEPAPNHFGEISSSIIVGVDYVVKHRQMDKEMGQPSVVAKLDENEELVFIS